MCQKYPGPRCASHVRKELASAELELKLKAPHYEEDSVSYREMVSNVETLQYEFWKTPTGQKELQARIENTTDEGEKRHLSRILAEAKIHHKAELHAGKLGDAVEAEILKDKATTDKVREENLARIHQPNQYLLSHASSFIDKGNDIASFDHLDHAYELKSGFTTAIHTALANRDSESLRAYAAKAREAANTLTLSDDRIPEDLGDQAAFEYSNLHSSFIALATRSETSAQIIENRRRVDRDLSNDYWKDRINTARMAINVNEIKADLRAKAKTAPKKDSTPKKKTSAKKKVTQDA